jgi:hypothetical protein
MGIVARFAHLLRTDAVFGYIELVVPVHPVEEPPWEPSVEEAPPARPEYAERTCGTCNVRIKAPPSRIRRVFGMHAERCDRAGPESRRAFRVKGRWPKRGPSCAGTG